MIQQQILHYAKHEDELEFLTQLAALIYDNEAAHLMICVRKAQLQAMQAPRLSPYDQRAEA